MLKKRLNVIWQHGLPDFQFASLKCSKAKCNKVRYACITYFSICFCWLIFVLFEYVFCFCFLGDGNCSDTRGLEIAIKQRVDDALTSKLPMFYLVNRPHISLVPSAYPFQTNLEYKFLSLNWAQGDISLEIVDGLSGKITERLALLISSNVTYYLSKRMYFSTIYKDYFNSFKYRFLNFE